MKINTNTSSINAQHNLNKTKLETPLERLSSGKRINSAKDDAAGLAIAARMTTQILGTNVAIRNVNDGISLAQTAEGGLDEASNMLQRIRELAIQSANATNSSSDRQALQAEASQLSAELHRLSNSTEFNGKKLLDGSFANALFQAGANAGQTINATSGNFQTDQYGNHQVAGNESSVAATDRIIAAGSLDIISSAGTTTVNYDAGASAQDVAAAVNQQADATGVSATTSTQTDITFSAAGSYSLNISADNGTVQTVSFTLDASSGAQALSQAVTAFNEQSATTGVIASVNGDGSGITLNHFSGETITVSDTSNANAGDVTVNAGATSRTLTADAVSDAAVVTGQVKFNSDSNFTVTGTAAAVTTNASEASALQAVAQLDISSVDQANSALSIIDAAIANVSAQRANFGALQSKFESSVRNSETYSVNLSGARSRIADADYAKETSELTRALILKKSGLAMLGQANMIPHVALGLLNQR
ncbi:MAG: flagellin [Gammaproteobacteria bacterium]|nr:flagellin [Gammaproteobacteria bacterium]